MAKREEWLVTNNTNKMINIGDLPKVPTFDPGDTHDLLKFQKRDEIAQSINLKSLLNISWLKLNKKKDQKSEHLNASVAKDGVSPTEENELATYALLDNVYTRDVLYTAAEVDALISGGSPMLASSVIVIPTGNLTANNAQTALEDHQGDIDTNTTNIGINTTNISTNATNILGKITKISAPITGNFPVITGTGEIGNASVSPDDFYTKAQINALTYSHNDLTDLTGGAAGDRYHLTTVQHSNLTGGTPSFNTVTITNAPSNNTDSTNKSYVDSAVAGASTWLESVLDFKTEATATTTLGNRYIASADGASWDENKVYEYNGSGWDETVVVSGNSTYISAESSAYIFNGTDWVKTGGVSDHNSLNGLQGGTGGGTPERYHLTSAAATAAETLNVSSPTNFDKLVYNTATSKWINDNPDEITHKSATAVLTETHGIFFMDTTTGNIQLTIPDSVLANDNSGIMRFYKATTDSNTVTIVTSGGQNIGGSSSQIIYTANQGFSCVSDYNSGSNSSWKIIQDNRKTTAAVARIFTVATAGAQYTSVTDAISAINTLGDASSTNRYVITVAPGIYTENPLTVPDYVSIMGQNDEATFIKANNNSATFISLGHDSVLYNLRVDGPTASLAVYSDDESELVRCTIQNAQTAIQANSASGRITVEEVKIKSSCTTGITAINNSWIGASNIFSEASTTSFYANGGTILLHNSFSSSATTHIHCNNTGKFYPHLVDCIGGTNVLRTGPTGVNLVIGSAVHADSDSTWHILQESATDDIHMTSCLMLATKLSMTNADLVKIDFNSDLEGDEGHLFYEELQVGAPEKGREAVFGEGDSYTRGMLVYTETTGGVFTNVSTAAASASGSTFTFTGTAVNNSIYVSSDLQDSTDYKKFLGIKASITVGETGAGGIISEYWNGSSWTEFNSMSAKSGPPYTQYGNALFKRAGSEQIRFQDLSVAAATWTKNDPPTTGTTRFWVRFRINSTVVSAPIFEQFKVHSNRTEINADGFVEHMGLARKRRPLSEFTWPSRVDINTYSPANEDINYDGDQLVLDQNDNEYQNNAVDINGFIINVPEGLDTSMPLTVNMRFAPIGTGSGNVEWEALVGTIQVGTTLSGGNTFDTYTDIVSVGPNASNQVYASSISFSVPTLLVDDQMIIGIKRDATGDNADDTFAGGAYIIHASLLGYFWN